MLLLKNKCTVHLQQIPTKLTGENGQHIPPLPFGQTPQLLYFFTTMEDKEEGLGRLLMVLVLAEEENAKDWKSKFLFFLKIKVLVFFKSPNPIKIEFFVGKEKNPR